MLFYSLHLLLHDARLRGDAVVVFVALVASARATFHGHIFGHNLEERNALLNHLSIKDMGPSDERSEY